MEISITVECILLTQFYLGNETITYLELWILGFFISIIVTGTGAILSNMIYNLMLKDYADTLDDKELKELKAK